MTSLEGIDAYSTNSRTNEWKKGWIIVLSAFFISFIVDGFIFSFGIILVEILDSFGESRATTSAIGSILSAMQHGIGTGTFVFIYGLRLLIDQFGWRGTMLLKAGVVLQGVVLGLVLADSKSNEPKIDEEKTSIVSSIKSFVHSILSLELLRDFRCCVFLLATLLNAIAFIVPFTFVPDQAAQAGMSKTQAAMLTSSIGGYVALLAVAFVDMAKPDFTSNAFGLIQLVTGISAMAATPLAGYLFDQTGSYNITFIVCGAEFVLGAILLCMCNLFHIKD